MKSYPSFLAQQWPFLMDKQLILLNDIFLFINQVRRCSGGSTKLLQTDQLTIQVTFTDWPQYLMPTDRRPTPRNAQFCTYRNLALHRLHIPRPTESAAKLWTNQEHEQDMRSSLAACRCSKCQNQSYGYASAFRTTDTQNCLKTNIKKQHDFCDYCNWFIDNDMTLSHGFSSRGCCCHMYWGKKRNGKDVYRKLKRRLQLTPQQPLIITK